MKLLIVFFISGSATCHYGSPGASVLPWQLGSVVLLIAYTVPLSTQCSRFRTYDEFSHCTIAIKIYSESYHGTGVVISILFYFNCDCKQITTKRCCRHWTVDTPMNMFVLTTAMCVNLEQRLTLPL